MDFKKKQQVIARQLGVLSDYYKNHSKVESVYDWNDDCYFLNRAYDSIYLHQYMQVGNNPRGQYAICILGIVYPEMFVLRDDGVIYLCFEESQLKNLFFSLTERYKEADRRYRVLEKMCEDVCSRLCADENESEVEEMGYVSLPEAQSGGEEML